MSMDMMNAKVSTCFDLMTQIEQLQAEAIKDELKDQMTERETEELEGTGWRTTWRNTNNSRFNSKRFKTGHADLYDQYTVKTTVAAKYDTTKARVERSMRHAVEKSFTQCLFDVITKYFGNGYPTDKGKATNSEFIAGIVHHLQTGSA